MADNEELLQAGLLEAACVAGNSHLVLDSIYHALEAACVAGNELCMNRWNLLFIRSRLCGG